MSAQVGGFPELRARISGMMGAQSCIVCLVGAGGKTSTLFALARSFAEGGARVCATTTTHIMAPDAGSEHEGRGFGPLLVLPDPAAPRALARLADAGPRVVLAAGQDTDEQKLLGVPPRSLAALSGVFDLVLVEADGARRLPIKAPAAHEPVIPRECSAVIGVIGLDALGAPMDGRTVHRPEVFGPLVGCAPGQAITAAHILRLVSSPAGLFKAAPPGAQRLLLLNKADAALPGAADACARGILGAAACDAVFIGSAGLSREAVGHQLRRTRA